MAEPKYVVAYPEHAVGHVAEVSDGATIVRPDESRAIVTGTQYVLDVPGEFDLGGLRVTAKGD